MYAFITGASSGIGREFAILLAEKGYDLILIGRRNERLIELKSKLEETYHIHIKTSATDISVEENCNALIQNYSSLPIEIVINNAGLGTVGEFSTLSEHDIEKDLEMIKTNVIAPHIFTKFFAGHIKSGYILNVSSITAFTQPPLFATYGATKSYLYALGSAVNYEMKQQKKDISITTLCPGSVRTEFYRDGGTQSNTCIITARQCAEIALDGMFKRKELVIPTVSMKLSYHLTRILPKSIMNPIQYHLQKKKGE